VADGLLEEEIYDLMHNGGEPTCAGGSGAGNPVDGELPCDGDAADCGGVSEAEAESIRDAVAADVLAAEKDRPGSVPAGAVVWANARATHVKPTWRAALARIIAATSRLASSGRERRSYRRMYRRQKEGMPLRPGKIARNPRFGLVLDTSGSMGRLGDVALGTAKALARRYAVVAEYDCDVTAQRVGRDRVHRGGGGTDLRAGIEAALHDNVDAVIVVTDGETPWPDEQPDVPVVAILVGENPTAPPGWVRSATVA
jgi:hypothetical protein